MSEQREAFNIRVKACRKHIVARLLGTGYWDRWLVNMVLTDTKNMACEETCEHGKRMNDYCEPCGRINGGG